MKKLKLSLLSLLAFSALALPLASCGGSQPQEEPCEVLTDSNARLATPVTDSVEFQWESDYATKDFFETQTGLAYGKATLSSVTDGDTMGWTTVNGHYIKTRLIGINTPESTAKVEAWGVKASAFAKDVLLSATDYCLANDISVWGKTDNTSSARSLAVVWYKNAEGKWRLYNLEVVEQCYSRNLFLDKSDNLPYFDAFAKVEEKNVRCGYRVYGTSDPDYVGSKDVMEVTLYYVRHHFSELGIDYQSGSSGKYLHVTALVVGMIGDHMVLRDLSKDPDQTDSESLECMYAYAGYGSGLASRVKVGNIVRFYCRASKFPTTTENVQLTDMETSTASGYEYRFVTYSPSNTHYKEYIPEGTTFGYDYDPVDLTSLDVTSSSSLDAYSGRYVKINVTIRNATIEKDDDGATVEVNTYHKETYNATSGALTATTIYAYAATSVTETASGTRGTPLNLRIDANARPLLAYQDFELGKTYTIKAYMSPYYDNYQLALFNNVSDYQYVTLAA